MTTHIIPMTNGSDYEMQEYGVEYRSTFVYETSGRGFHNLHFPHRFKVWNNTVRPNEAPVYGPDAPGSMGYGKIGPGKYVDPERKGTDEKYNYRVGSESISITNSGTNTGTEASGQVWSPLPAPLTIGDVIILQFPDGSLSEPFKLTSRVSSDPQLVPMT